MSQLKDTEVVSVDAESLGHRKAVEGSPSESVSVNLPPVPVVPAAVAETYVCGRCKYTWRSDNFAVVPPLVQVHGRKFLCPSCWESWVLSYIPPMRKVD